MSMYNENYYAVIMAGGIGTRLWPVSTSKYPKQFHDMLGAGESLLQGTFHRLSRIVPFKNILVLTNVDYEELVQQQLPDIKKDQIVLEPAMRNTAPCILMAAMKIQKMNPDAVMMIAPSDHWIKEKDNFVEDIEKAFEIAAKENYLITLGIKPSGPKTGYGYIKHGTEEKQGLQKVEKFTEKPSLPKAKKFIENGNYLWNAGIFIWKVSTILDSFKENQQEMYSLFEKGNKAFNTKKEAEFVNTNYSEAQNISIDYAILEKSDSVYVIPASFDWNDLGTWGALYEELAKDENGNAAIKAGLMPSNSKNNLVYSHDKKVVVLDGLEDFMVINDKDVLMIIPKKKESDIKQIREDAIKNKGQDLG